MGHRPLIEYTSDEEFVISDLGKAVSWLWDDLPSDVQEKIRHEAIISTDDVTGVREDLEALLEKHRWHNDSARQT